jgi:hypothetical protein
MRGSWVKKACPMLNDAEGSQCAGPAPGVHANVALGARKVFHSSNENAEFIKSESFNSITSGLKPA